MIDSGSDVSLINIGVIRRLKKLGDISNTNANLSGANGLPVKTLGEINLGFQLEGVYFRNKFLVIENFSHDLLLGKDFLCEKGGVIDFEKGNMKIRDISIPFVDRNQLTVTSECKQVLKGYSTMVIPVKTNDLETHPKGDSIFVEGGILDADNRIFIPKCLLRPDGMIQITNTSNVNIIIEKDQNLATGIIIREYSKATPSFFCNKISREFGEYSETAKRGVTAKDLGVEDLSHDEQENLVRLINDSGVIREKLGKVSSLKHEIDTNGATPINTRQYRCPISKRELLRNEAQKMIVSGVVKPSNSPWNSPVVLVAKPSGEQRFAIDFRKVNSVTKKQAYPVPRIDDCLNSLGTGKYFTCLDLESAYWQVPLEEEAKQKTAFSVEGLGHLEFQVMPYGLVNAGQLFNVSWTRH